MKKFLDDDFLLTTETAKHLYHDCAQNQPIIDYHCHLSPKEIFEDVQYENITRVWLGGDHYKWRQMRAGGVEERYITGDAGDREKFQKWAEILEVAIGNPLYHWSHLELKNYFGYHGNLCGETAEEVWRLCNEKLQSKEMSARNLILQSGVKVLCTTDDPADSMEWHQKLAQDESFPVRVLPAWRPDRAMNLCAEDYTEYLEKLSQVSGVAVSSFSALLEALEGRMDFFAENGCCISDHGMEVVVYRPAQEEQIEAIFQKRLRGKPVSREEGLQFQTAFLLAMGRRCAKRNWVMQLHYGVQRNLNRKIYQVLGADAGIDAIANQTSAVELGRFLDALAVADELPRMILYSLNPSDNAAIDTVIGCFQDSSAVGKLQHGAAWWFNDHKAGMTEQMTSLANLGLLGNFIGMLTDSRSFLSYARHEYFRRILCELIGGWVENGEYPNDERLLMRIVKGISYENARRYFGF